MSERRLRNPFIVPIFIPNQGCPYRCIFCHQEKITAQSTQAVNGKTIKQILDDAVRSPKFDVTRDRQAAFYGGTFTRLSTERMEGLLEAVKPYLREGLFTSIRVSTRPDAIDKKRLDLMKAYGVLTVELGAQSMDDDVLALSKRGHGALDTVRSVQLLRQQGLKVGIQLMPGLPGDSENKFMKTVDEVIRLQPDVVRLYPAVVIKGTELAEWHKEKRYQPLGLEEAVNVCRESCIRLEANGIPVIRMGLMSSPSLRQEGQIVAGPWHEAFGFLVRSGIYQKNIEPLLPDPGEAAKIILRVHSGDIPLARGYQNLGLRSIEDKTGAKVIKVMADETVPSGQIGVDKI